MFKQAFFALILLIILTGCPAEDTLIENSPKANFVSVSPKAGETISSDSVITLTYDIPPNHVSVWVTIDTVGDFETTETGLEIYGPFPPGDVSIQVLWNGGEKWLNYSVAPAPE